jgi:LmbE family N-acetylglucosaminyl deacetylase
MPNPADLPSQQDGTSRVLLGVWAHPDDEAYLSAMLMARTIDTGGDVTCVTATRGELGTPDPRRCRPEALAAIRTVEAEASLAVLGVTDHRWLDLPDGGCAPLPSRRWAGVIGQVIDEIRPDDIVTFGPDGMTGHPDHVAVSGWTTAAWAVRGGPGRLHYATTIDTWAARHARMHQQMGLFEPGLPATVPAHRLSLAVELDDVESERKLAALRCHRSQTEALELAMGEACYREWWDVEAFRPPSPSEIAAAVASVYPLAA